MYCVNQHIGTNIRRYFESYDCEVVDMKKMIKYLKEYNYLFTYNEIMRRFVNCSEIKCPMEYLNTDYIFDCVKDNYLEVGYDKCTENGEILYLDIDDFDCDDAIGDVIDKGLVIDKELLEQIMKKYGVNEKEVFENMELYRSETYDE